MTEQIKEEPTKFEHLKQQHRLHNGALKTALQKSSGEQEKIARCRSALETYLMYDGMLIIVVEGDGN